MSAGDVLLDSAGNVRLDTAGNVMLSDGAGDTCCCGAVTCSTCGLDSTLNPATGAVTHTYAAKYTPLSTATFSYSVTMKSPGGTVRSVSGTRTAIPIAGESGGVIWQFGDKNLQIYEDSPQPYVFPLYYQVRKICNGQAADRGFWTFTDYIDSPFGDGHKLVVFLRLGAYGPHPYGFSLANLWRDYSRKHPPSGTAASAFNDADDYFLEGSGNRAIAKIVDYVLTYPEGYTDEEGTYYPPDESELPTWVGTPVHLLSVNDFDVSIADGDRCTKTQPCGDLNKDDFCSSLQVTGASGLTVHPIGHSQGSGTPAAPDLGSHAISGPPSGSAHPDPHSDSPRYTYTRPFDLYVNFTNQQPGSAGYGVANAYGPWEVVGYGAEPYSMAGGPPTDCRWLVGVTYTGPSSSRSGTGGVTFISDDADIGGGYTLYDASLRYSNPNNFFYALSPSQLTVDGSLGASCDADIPPFDEGNDFP